jgi:hypothetical protein
MKKISSFVLQAIGVLSLEQILKLTKVLKLKQGQLKKAVGEELISLDDHASSKQGSQSLSQEAKVIPINAKKSQLPSIEMPPSEEEVKKKKEEEEKSNLLTSDIILWQREITRDTGEAIHKMGAVKGYKKSTEMYVVKTKTEEGKEKIRFASTDGVLVNKKQA